MKCLFNYCFYRIALFYKKRMPLEDYITQGHTVLVSAICFYCIALLNIVLFFVGYKLTKEIVIVLLIPFCIIILLNAQVFPNSKQLFEKMEKELGRERFHWFKGLLVFLFVIGSFASMFFVSYLKKIIGQ